jgi:hypothetical protein
MEYLMSQLPPEMLEGVEICTTSDFLAEYGEGSLWSDETEERHQRNAEVMTQSPGGHAGDFSGNWTTCLI